MITMGRTQLRVATPVGRQAWLELALDFTVSCRDRFELPDGPLIEQMDTYAEVAGVLDSVQAYDRLLNMACVIDLSAHAVQTWDVLTDIHPMRPTWLVRRFPEVYWIFVVGNIEEVGTVLPKSLVAKHFVEKRLGDATRLKSILERHANGFRNWFDPTWLRASTVGIKSKDSRDANVGLVLDDELDFCAFNGYLLYRLGIPTFIVASASEFLALASDSSALENRQVILLEDLELNYADQREADKGVFIAEVGVSVQDFLESRLERLGLQAASKPSVRILITSSLVLGYDCIIKPFSGLYDRVVAKHLRLLEVNVEQQILPHQRSESVNLNSHSAQANCQAIAARLITRAKVIRSSVHDTKSAIHVALLAFEAEHLLNHKTYALTLECLTLRHGMEAAAECAFAGSADDLAVAPRVADAKTQILRLVFHCATIGQVTRQLLPWTDGFRSNWLKLHKRSLQYSKGMLEVVGKLRETYGAYRKFGEEEYSLQRIRHWRIRAFILKHSLSDRLGWFVFKSGSGRGRSAAIGMITAAEMLVRAVLSVPLFYITRALNPLFLVSAALAWIWFFSRCFANIADAGLLLGVKCFQQADWLRHSAVTFLAMQQGVLGDPKWKSCSDVDSTVVAVGDGYALFWNLTVAEMAIGYLHLGLLVAVLVQRVMRR